MSPQARVRSLPPEGDAPPAARQSRFRGGTLDPARLLAQEAVDAHRDDGGGELFGISQLCAEFGITLRTIRFYEDKGLLAPQRVNGTRVYTRRDRARLALILRSKAIGAPLAEIKHFLDLYGAHGEGRVQQMKFVVERTDKAIAELETKRAHIEATLAELRFINTRVREALQASKR